jgi:hypothetical protein
MDAMHGSAGSQSTSVASRAPDVAEKDS